MAAERVGHVRLVKRGETAESVSSGSMSRVAAVAADLVGSEGIFMGESRLPPGLSSTPHVHTNCESALYIQAGRGRFVVGENLDQTLRIEEGDFLYVPPQAPHLVVNDGEVDLVMIVARNTQVEQVEEYRPPRSEDAGERQAPVLGEPLLTHRCKTCGVAIRGPLGALSRVRGIRPYGKNPQLCNRCERRIKGAEERVVTALFADIRGYTQLSFESANQQVVETLRRFFHDAAPIVHRHMGIVDQFLGDGMMALFNVPSPRNTHAQDALECALSIQEQLADAPFGVGVGVETGMAMAGHIGVDEIVDFTAVGEAVNVASRLQGLARAGDVVLGPNIARKVADLVQARALSTEAETVEVKGVGTVAIQRIRLTSPAAHA